MDGWMDVRYVRYVCTTPVEVYSPPRVTWVVQLGGAEILSWVWDEDDGDGGDDGGGDGI